MGWLDDILGNLGKAASNHEELLGAIPLIAGSALLARNGRAGGPIGAGLTALGGLMELRNQQQQPQSPIEFYNPKTQQIEYQTPTVGQPLTPPSGYQPFDVYKLEQQKKQVQGAKPFPIFNSATGEERFFDPSKSDTLPKGFVSASFYKKPGEEKLPGGIYAGAREKYLLSHPGDEAGADDYAAKAEIAARIASRPVTNLNVETPVPPSNLIPNPADPTGKSSILLEHDKGGNLSTRVVNVPAPAKGKTLAGATKDDINTALDQMGGMLKILGTKPGIGAAAAGAARYGKSLAGYPSEAEFQGAAAALSDMIPKALAGRSSQSAIDNAMKYMVPSLHDTQQSAQRKLNNLKQLFKRNGLDVADSALPSISPPTPPAGFK